MPGASRALWTRLVPPGRSRDAAFSYEAISLEVFFILGPSLAALLVLRRGRERATAVALVLMVTGSAGFALTHAVRTQRPAAERAPRAARGAAVPGMRTIVLASLGFGLVIGSVEVGVPAVTAAAGSAALGGVLLSAWSITSVLAGVAYSLRPWPRPLHLRLPVLLAARSRCCVGAMAVAGPLPALVVAMLLAGATITPQVTAHSLGVEATAPEGHGDRGVRLGGHGGHAGAVVRAVDVRHGRGGVRAARGVRGRRGGGRGRRGRALAAPGAHSARR